MTHQWPSADPVLGSMKPHSFQNRVEGMCIPRSFINAAESPPGKRICTVWSSTTVSAMSWAKVQESAGRVWVNPGLDLVEGQLEEARVILRAVLDHIATAKLVETVASGWRMLSGGLDRLEVIQYPPAQSIWQARLKQGSATRRR